MELLYMHHHGMILKIIMLSEKVRHCPPPKKVYILYDFVYIKF